MIQTVTTTATMHSSLPVTSGGLHNNPNTSSSLFSSRKVVTILTPLVVLLFIVSRQFSVAGGDEAYILKSNNGNNAVFSNDENFGSNTPISSVPQSILPEANVPTSSFHLGEEHANPVYRPIVISGPSGVGKGTLINMIVEFYHDKADSGLSFNGVEHHDNNDLFGFSVSHTTRGPRPGEVDGVHYHFTSRAEMEKGIKENLFIEHAEVHGNFYGTSYEAVQSVSSSGRICILDIDIQGAKNIKSSPNLKVENNSLPYFIFIKPPSMELLEKRLRDRGTETEEAIVKRLGNAAREIEYGTESGHFDEVVVNDDLESAFLRLRLILEEWFPHLNQKPSSGR